MKKLVLVCSDDRCIQIVENASQNKYEKRTKIITLFLLHIIGSVIDNGTEGDTFFELLAHAPFGAGRQHQIKTKKKIFDKYIFYFLTLLQ